MRDSELPRRHEGTKKNLYKIRVFVASAERGVSHVYET
jgi:hypothetical protein